MVASSFRPFSDFPLLHFQLLLLCLHCHLESYSDSETLIKLHQNPLIEEQGGPWVDIIDHWSIIDHFAKMVDVLEFVVDITLKWSIFYQKISQEW